MIELKTTRTDTLRWVNSIDVPLLSQASYKSSNHNSMQIKRILLLKVKFTFQIMKIYPEFSSKVPFLIICTENYMFQYCENETPLSHFRSNNFRECQSIEN